MSVALLIFSCNESAVLGKYINMEDNKISAIKLPPTADVGLIQFKIL
jgi:hypothetical protein